MKDDLPKISGKPASRASERLVITIGFLLANFLWIPMTMGGRHFDSLALVPVIPSLLWGLYALITHRGGAERWVGWVAFFTAILSFVFQFRTSS